MDISEKSFQEQINMVRKALSSKEGESELIEYLDPIVGSEGENTVNEWVLKKGISITDKEKKEAIEEGWLALPLALRKYKEKLDLIDKGEDVEIHKISEYLPWLVRQAVIKHLDQNHGLKTRD